MTGLPATPSSIVGMAEVNDWNQKVIEEFRSNGGRVEQFGDAPLLLLRTTGAKSGAERINPVMYLDLDGRRFVMASIAGAPTSPDWYHNLLANPIVKVEVGTEEYKATATPVVGEERDRIYEEQAGRFSTFAEYQSKTDRVIPVVELVRA